MCEGLGEVEDGVFFFLIFEIFFEPLLPKKNNSTLTP